MSLDNNENLEKGNKCSSFCSTSSSSSSCSSSCSSDDYCEIDDECHYTKIYCWPREVRPKELKTICKYRLCNIDKIPNGSIFFASRSGPLSSLNARVTGTPYNLIGIIVRVNKCGPDSVYVYIVDTISSDCDRLFNRVCLIPLKIFMQDASIIDMRIKRLKNFDVNNGDCSTSGSISELSKPNWPKDQNIGNYFKPGKAYEATIAANNAYIAGKIATNKNCDNSNSYCSTKGRENKKGCNKKCSSHCPSSSSCSSSSSSSCSSSSSSSSSCSSSSSSCSSSSPCSNECSFSSFSHVHSNKSWCHKLSEKRISILTCSLKKYIDLQGEYDDYQSLAQYFGYPVAEELRTKNYFTGPELVGRILFEAGLIWDDRMSIDGKNPYCCFDTCFWENFNQKVSKECNPVDAVIAFTNPNRPKICKPECDEAKLDCEKKFDNKRNIDENRNKQRFNSKHKPIPELNEDIDHQIGNHLRQFIIDSFNQGAETNIKTNCGNGSCDDSQYCTSKGRKKCCDSSSSSSSSSSCSCKCSSSSSSSCSSSSSSSCSSSSSSCSSSSSSDSCRTYLSPTERHVHAVTIMFGSLRIVDFLVDYYQARGIDYKGINNLCDIEKSLCNYGIAGDVASAIASLATQRAAGDQLDYSFNRLNLSWYDDNLIPIERCPTFTSEESCKKEWQKECKILERFSCQIQRDFIQKRMLNQDISGFSGSTLLILSKQLSNYLCLLHDLATSINAHVNWNGKEDTVRSLEDLENDSDELKIPIACKDGHKEYEVKSQSYMWGCSWKYLFPHILKCDITKHGIYCNTLCSIIEGLQSLYYRTPSNNILREIIYHVRKQAKCMKKWVNECRKHCVKSKSNKKQPHVNNYKLNNIRKAEDKKVEEKVNEKFYEKQQSRDISVQGSRLSMSENSNYPPFKYTYANRQENNFYNNMNEEDEYEDEEEDNNYSRYDYDENNLAGEDEEDMDVIQGESHVELVDINFE